MTLGIIKVSKFCESLLSANSIFVICHLAVNSDLRRKCDAILTIKSFFVVLLYIRISMYFNKVEICSVTSTVVTLVRNYDEIWDQCRSLSNCTPTPPLALH